MKSPIVFLIILISSFSHGFCQSSYRIIKANPARIHNASEKPEVPQTRYFTFSESDLQEIQSKPNQKIRLEIPFSENTTFQIDLNPDQNFTQNLVVRSSGGKLEKDIINLARHFKGSVSGKKSSLAAFSFSEWGPTGIFSFGSGNFNLVKSRFEENGLPVFALFNDQNIKEKQPFTCMADQMDPEIKIKPDFKNQKYNKGAVGIEACKRVSVFLECDNKMFIDNGFSLSNTVNWSTSMLNIVSALYANEGIRLTASEVFVHTQPDNYPESSSFAALSAFSDSLASRPPFNGDLAHLLSTKNNSLGGVAYLDVLCESFGNNCAYSNIYNAFAPLPVYSWTVNVVAHEIGHNFGSPHTQSCSWPIAGGGFGMLDSCYAAEGGCYSGPIVPIMGTIMSYCHLVMGVDLSSGFGPLPAALIRSKYLDATCLNGNVVFPILTISEPDTICSGSSAQLSISEVAGAEYEWKGPNGFISSQRQPVISPVSSIHNGLFTAVVKKDGCESYPLKTSLKIDCISVSGDGDKTLCPSQMIPLSYFAQFLPSSGNEFVAEISNSSGSFSNPVEIGRISSQEKNGIFSVQIPAGTPSGNGYFIRVRSEQPAQTGEPIGPFSVSSSGPAAQVPDVTRCDPGVVTLVGSGNYRYSWYEDTLMNSVATGPVFTTPELMQTTAFWVQSQGATKAQVGPLNPQFSGSSGPLSNFTQGLFFRVDKDLTIDSVTVVAAGAGNVVFRIRDSANTKTLAYAQSAVLGTQTLEKIKIGIQLNPGFYRVDAVGSTVTSLSRSSNVASFPFSSPGLLSITHPTADFRYYWFYDWKITGLDCPGPFKMVLARIVWGPNPPIVFSDSICRQGILNLQASGATTDETYQWYSPSGNAIPGANQAIFSTPVLNQTTTYSVNIKNSENCESPRRLVQAKVFPSPSPPLSDSVNACLGDTATLTATVSGSQPNSYAWFLNTLSPIAGASSSTIQVPALSPDSLFYVCSVSEKGCSSDTVSILLKTNPRPEQPTMEAIPRCGPGPVTLIAHGVSGATFFEWFSQETGGQPFPNASDSLFTTPPVTGNPVLYYVSPVSEFGCRLKNRAAILASFINRPADPTGSDSSRCGPGTLILRAFGGQLGEHFHWYQSPNALLSDTLVGGNSGSLNLTNQTQSANFYVSLVKDEFCESENRLLIRAKVLEQPPTPQLALEGSYLVCSIDTIYDWFKEGSFLLTSGDSLNPAQFGNGLYQAILKKSNGCSATSNSILISGKIPVQKLTEVKVFPNPARDQIKVRTSDATIRKASLFDLQLRKLEEQFPDSNEFQIPLYQFPKGMYILLLESLSGQIQPFTIQKE